MNKLLKAEILLFEINAIEEGDFEHRTRDLLVLTNEVFRDAKALALYIATEERNKLNSQKKAA